MKSFSHVWFPMRELVVSFVTVAALVLAMHLNVRYLVYHTRLKSIVLVTYKLVIIYSFSVSTAAFE